MSGRWSHERRSSRLRAALLTWDMPPAPTGLGRAADLVARGLLEAGVDVTVFSADRAGEETVDGLRVVGCVVSDRLARMRHRAALGHLAAPLAFRRALLREHERAPFDLVEATNWYAPATLVPRSLPLVVRCSTPASEGADPDAGLRDRLDLRFAHHLEARTARRADAVIHNTTSHATRMAKEYGLDDMGHVVGLALEEDVLRRGRAAGYPSGDAPTFLFIGRAERRKGFDTVPGAFAILRERWPQARLHLVGLSPGDLDAVETPDGIVDHGRASDETVAALMERTHVVLAPSRYESYGLVYREAAAWGRPVVMCAEDPSARSFAEEAGCGVLAERCEAGAVARAAVEAYERREALRCAGLAHARTLSRAALGSRTLAVYEAVLERRSGARAPDRS